MTYPGTRLGPVNAQFLTHFLYSVIVNLDNTGKEDGSDTHISSRMIVEQYGGVAGIAQSLFTNVKVSPLSWLTSLLDRNRRNPIGHPRKTRNVSTKGIKHSFARYLILIINLYKDT